MDHDEKPIKSKYGVKLVRGPFVRLPRHDLAVDTVEGLRDVVDSLEGPLAMDLFCGAGGLSLGLERAGFQVVVGVDHDDEALETHRAYHPGLSVNWDLADIEVVERVGRLARSLKIDLIAGGPPCQPFSRAGRAGMRNLVRKGVRPEHDMRRDLWQSFLRIVSLGRPRAVLMENVPDMALDRDMWILRTMVDELEALDYSVEARVVPTSDYGVPQVRQRLFLVALEKRTKFTWPEKSIDLTTVRNALGDLPQVDGGFRPKNGDDPNDIVASGWQEYEGPQTDFQRLMRSAVPPAHVNRIYDHITRPVRQDDAIAFAQMDPSTKYSDLAPELKRYRSDIFDDKYKRLDWDNLSRTIVAHIAKDGYWYIHPEQSRTITVREAARLQSFPDHIRFAGPPTAAFRQIGNAVPPLMGYHLGRAIISSLDGYVRAQGTTADTARRLAEWFDGQHDLAVPWLRATTRWQVIAAELLLARVGREHVRRAWEMLTPLQEPADVLDADNLQLLRFVSRRLGRLKRLDNVIEAAGWFVEHPETLAINAGSAELQRCPGVSPGAADLAVRVCPGNDEDRDEPVLVAYGALRVASRYFGDDVAENQNRLTDGRVALARMIGGDDQSHAAHLALFELAASVCSPVSPDCASCPLVRRCAYASQTSTQLTLIPPTPGPAPSQGR